MSEKSAAEMFGVSVNNKIRKAIDECNGIGHRLVGGFSGAPMSTYMYQCKECFGILYVKIYEQRSSTRSGVFSSLGWGFSCDFDKGFLAKECTGNPISAILIAESMIGECNE